MFMDELFSLLQKELLPKNDKLPTTSYEAHKIISLGLTYNSIHDCHNGCVLFQYTHKDADVCSKCQINKFMDGSFTISQKMFRHFLLIPKLIRMYKCKSMVERLAWHSIGTSSNGLIQSVADSIAWKHINENWPKFLIPAMWDWG